MTAMSRPPRRPWAAMITGVFVGLVALTLIVGWRTHLLDDVIARATQVFEPAPHAAPAAPQVPVGPLASRARLRIQTEPPGADVLKEKDGLPRLLGVTPLTLEWDVASSPAARKFVLRKEGYVPAVANVPAPAAGPTPVATLDVEATLRPEPLR